MVDLLLLIPMAAIADGSASDQNQISACAP
jgi:hypothetical protein